MAVPESASNNYDDQYDSGVFNLNDSHRSKSWRFLVDDVHSRSLKVVLSDASGTSGASVHVIPNYTSQGNKLFQENEEVIDPTVTAVSSDNWAVALSFSLYEAESDVDLLQEIHLTSNYYKVIQKSINQQPEKDRLGGTQVSAASSLDDQFSLSTPCCNTATANQQSILEQSPTSRRTATGGMQLNFEDDVHMHVREHGDGVQQMKSSERIAPRRLSSSHSLLVTELSQRSTLLSDQYISAAQAIRNTGNSDALSLSNMML